MLNNKKSGTIGEYAFVVEALKQGLDVYTPIGDYSTTDILVENPDGKHFRVQVKTTGKRIDNHRFKVVVGQGLKKQRLKRKDVDVLAVYLSSIDCWFIIPMSKTKGQKTFALYTQRNSKSQWSRYKNNWDLFFHPKKAPMKEINKLKNHVST
jgi:hypothetical protein